MSDRLQRSSRRQADPAPAAFHDGTIHNADYLLRRWKLRRLAGGQYILGEKLRATT
jgi:hypothetical protein